MQDPQPANVKLIIVKQKFIKNFGLLLSFILLLLASKILNRGVHGFTIINKDKRYEEQTNVNKAVKELEVKHTSIELDQKNFIENLSSLINIHDAPVYLSLIHI